MSVPPKDPIEVMEQGVLSHIVLDDGFGREFILVLQYSIWLHNNCILTLHFSVSFLLGNVKSATSGPVKKIGDMLRLHPENFIPDQETAFLKVASGCCAYSDVFWISTII